MHSAAKIFLCEQRGLIETSSLKSLCTFNFGSYYNQHKQAFGSLNVFNDEALDCSAEINIQVAAFSYLILIPITGDLQYEERHGNSLSIEIGNLLIKGPAPFDRSFRLVNPYEEEINFLYICIKTDGYSTHPITSVIGFELDRYPNTLIEIFDKNHQLPFKISISQFGGRQETLYKTNSANAGLFSFVLAGAFELEGRLLQPRDGLALWDIKEIELEALSNYATLLIIELPDSNI